MSSNPKNQVLSFLKRAQKILLIAPKDWSGDQVAAMMALHSILSSNKKEVISIAPHKVPHKFEFLGEQKFIRKDLEEEGDFVMSISTEKTKVDRVKYTIKDNEVDIIVSPKSGRFHASDVSFHQSSGTFDVIVTLGVNSLDEVGEFFEENPRLFSSTPIINIAVSPTNEFFGRINLIDPTCSSVCEILYDMISKEEDYLQHLNERIATLLLTGIISATGSFLEPNTTASSFEAAAKLQEKGANQSDIIEHLFKMKALSTLKLWGRILGNLEIDPIHHISWASLSKADFEISDADPDDRENISDNILRHIKQNDLAALFIETGDNTVIEIRTDSPAVDIHELHKTLGSSGKIVSNGLNFIIPGKGLVEVQFEILKLLLQFQKKRLHISSDVEMQKMRFEADIKEVQPEESPSKNHKTVTPEAPKHIPFEVSTREAEKIQDKPVENSKKEPPAQKEKEINTKDTNLPDWLKKKSD